MKQSELEKILDDLQTNLYPEIFEQIFKDGQAYYNKLIQEGYDMDQALYNLTHATAYTAVKMAVSITLGIVYGIEPDDETNENPLKSIIKRIK